MMHLLDIARLFKHVHEAGPNSGQRVEGIQLWTGGEEARKKAWCAAFAWMVLDLYYAGQCPYPRSTSCDDWLAKAKERGEVIPLPEPGALYLRLNSPTDAHHIGFCTSALHDGVFGQLSGNTSKDGLSSNGDGVYERDVKMPAPDKIAFVRIPPSPQA